MRIGCSIGINPDWTTMIFGSDLFYLLRFYEAAATIWYSCSCDWILNFPRSFTELLEIIHWAISFNIQRFAQTRESFSFDWNTRKKWTGIIFFAQSVSARRVKILPSGRSSARRRFKVRSAIRIVWRALVLAIKEWRTIWLLSPHPSDCVVSTICGSFEKFLGFFLVFLE